MSDHLSDETLAAFADGKVKARAAREAAIEHLASCDDCRSVYDAVADAQAAEVIDRAPVVVGNFGKQVIGTLAVAAAATIVFFTPPVQEQVAAWRTGEFSRLVKASEGQDQRPVAGRLGGFSSHKPFDVTRGNGEDEGNLSKWQLEAAAAKVIEANDGPSAKELRAKGLGYLLLGERDEAVKYLELASKAAGDNDPLILSDLAAAYLSVNDLKAAREKADRAWQLRKTPETAWNRALVLEYAADPGAKAAWNDYLALDPSSPWAKEVRDKYLAPEL